ncbi:MAG: methylenetetrahydrofolate reductase C-terminal domain-containing protein [Anaerolineae bacterium]|nr:methylenetetrahydrofolate reductase C-terminal domain-containing protein [Anaerolineae bacterium]
MIIAERKPIDELKAIVAPYERILLVGCGTCVAVCFAGGEQETAILASLLRMATRLDGQEKTFDEVTVQRQCEWEFLDEIGDRVDNYDLILSLACGIGVQAIVEHFPQVRVAPALNTSFLGLPVEQGIWAERCQACGNCILHLTGGICPIARCAKSLLNGPCGGSQNGHCEVDPNVDCAWHLIYERLKAQGQLHLLEEIQPPKDWSTSRDGGPRRIVREDLIKVKK